MSLAWATILFILLMLPGVAVLMGIAAPERFSREVVRSTALGEIALAAFTAIIIHAFCLAVLGALFASPLDALQPIIEYELKGPVAFYWDPIKDSLRKIILYQVLTTIVGFAGGLLISKMIHNGPLRALATHSWIYDVVKHTEGSRGLVTAYIMTKTVEDGKALMYKGRLAEIFLKEDGNISYIAMKNCRRFYMKFDDLTTTGEQLKLFNFNEETYEFHEWNYLMIGGDQIANVLFNKSPIINENKAGLTALDKALAEDQALNATSDGLDEVVSHSATD